MAEVTLTATTGRPLGSSASRRLRAEGKIPATGYGMDKDAVGGAHVGHHRKVAGSPRANQVLADLDRVDARRVLEWQDLQPERARSKAIQRLAALCCRTGLGAWTR